MMPAGPDAGLLRTCMELTGNLLFFFFFVCFVALYQTKLVSYKKKRKDAMRRKKKLVSRTMLAKRNDVVILKYDLEHKKGRVEMGMERLALPSIRGYQKY